MEKSASVDSGRDCICIISASRRAKGGGGDETNLVAVGRLAVTVVAILVPKGEQPFGYASLHLVRRVLRGCHGRRVWLQRRIVLSRGRGGGDQKPNGSRLSSDEQLAHFFAGGGRV